MLAALPAFSQYVLEGDTLYKSPESLIVTANRYEKNVFETCIPSAVLTPELRTRNSMTFFDILQENPGTTFSQAGPWSMKPVIRGLAGNHVLTLVDGLKLNVLRGYGNHAPLIDLYQIDKIEVIRGPASVMYGSDAVAGVINIMTKQPAPFTSTFSADYSAGAMYNSVNNQYSEFISLSGTSRRTSFLVSFNNRTADNLTTPAGELNNTAFSGKALTTDVKFKISRSQQLRIKTEWNRMDDVGVPINPFAVTAHFKKYNRDVYQAEYVYTPASNKWSSVKAKAFYQSGERNFSAEIRNTPKGTLFANNDLNAHRLVTSYGFDVQGGRFLFANNLLTFGVEGFHNADDTERTSDAFITNADGAVIKNPPVDTTPPTPQSIQQGIGAFIEDEWNVSSLLTLTMGARYDAVTARADATPNTLAQEDIEHNDHDFSASLGMLYKLTDEIRVFFNTGRAFKSPTLQERFFKGTAQVGYLTGNPDLVSETSLNFDTGIKFQADRMRGEISLFSNSIDNYIVMEPATAARDTFEYSNIGKASLLGGEFYFSVNPVRNISMFVNGSYVYGRDTNTDTPLSMMPPLNGTAGIKIHNNKSSLWFETSLTFYADQERLGENETRTPGYGLTSVTLGADLGKFIEAAQGYSCNLQVNNLFDRSYINHLSTITWWDGPGRNISFSIIKRFR